MTVCIAAICYHSMSEPLGRGPFIVTVSDTMVSGGIIASDMAVLKSEPFHEHWMAMLAADDLTQAMPIIQKAEEYFKGRNNTLAVARSVFKRAFQQHVREMREDAVLSGYGMTMAEFTKSGKRRFTERKFESLCEQMEKIDPKCEFLVHGFDSSKRAHLFRVSGVGTDELFDKPGFCSIGSGKWAADSILYYLGQSVDRSLSETIYHCCAAKFMAERSEGVGEDTYLYVRRFGSKSFSHGANMINEVRRSWEKEGCPRISVAGLTAISRSGYHFDPSHERISMMSDSE